MCKTLIVEKRMKYFWSRAGFVPSTVLLTIYVCSKYVAPKFLVKLAKCKVFSPKYLATFGCCAAQIRPTTSPPQKTHCFNQRGVCWPVRCRLPTYEMECFCWTLQQLLFFFKAMGLCIVSSCFFQALSTQLRMFKEWFGARKIAVDVVSSLQVQMDSPDCFVDLISKSHSFLVSLITDIYLYNIFMIFICMCCFSPFKLACLF